MSGKHQVGIGNGHIFGIVGSMRQQNNEVLRSKGKSGRLSVLPYIERIAYTSYHDMFAIPPQGVRLMLQQMYALPFHFLQDIIITRFIIVVSKNGISTQRCFHRSQRSNNIRNILASLMQIAAYQQGVRMQIVQQAGYVLQSLLFQQAPVMQVGDKSQPASVERRRNITMSKLILPDAFHILVSGCRRPGHADSIFLRKRRNELPGGPARGKE